MDGRYRHTVAHILPNSLCAVVTLQVKSVCWNADDTKLISAGMDGAVYEWRLRDCKREKENVMKGCLYNSCATSSDGKLLFAAGSDRCKDNTLCRAD